MQENMKEYLTEKEAKEKRLEVYTEKIQEKVLSRSSETIRQLVEERHRQKMTQQEIADITGIKPSNMARFESGGRVPTLVVLEKYANALVLDDSILQKNIQRAEEATDYEEVNKMNRILEGYGYNKEINIYPYCDLDSILRGCTIIDITGSQSQFRLDSKYFNYNIPIYIGEMDDFHNLFDINSINEFRNDDKLDNIYRIVQQYL